MKSNPGSLGFVWLTDNDEVNVSSSDQPPPAVSERRAPSPHAPNRLQTPERTHLIPVADLPRVPYWRRENDTNLIYCLEGNPVHYIFEGRLVSASLRGHPQYLALALRKLELRHVWYLPHGHSRIQIPPDTEIKFSCPAEVIQGHIEWPIFQQNVLRNTTTRIFRVPYTSLCKNDRLRVDCSLLRRLDYDDEDAFAFIVHTAIRI